VIGDFQPPASDALLDWALAYAATGVRFFPVGTNNGPLTERGLKDAVAHMTPRERWAWAGAEKRLHPWRAQAATRPGGSITACSSSATR
jgi:hypothetical protein